VPPPDEGVARMYHSAWEVGELTDLVRARQRLTEAGALVGSSDHGVSLSLYAKDPDGLEFEVFWTVPGGTSVGTRPLHLEAELAMRGITVP
jgi:catechol-2,3-dioxygenase